MIDAQSIGLYALIGITLCNCLFALLMVSGGMSLYIGMPLSCVCVSIIIFIAKRKLVGREKMWRRPSETK